jgi:hypothetical protein
MLDFQFFLQILEIKFYTKNQPGFLISWFLVKPVRTGFRSHINIVIPGLNPASRRMRQFEGSEKRYQEPGWLDTGRSSTGSAYVSYYTRFFTCYRLIHFRTSR